MAAMNVSTNYIEKEENVWLKLVEMLSKNAYYCNLFR